ncbi:ENR1 protein, partial [Podargus strigoides]|nr:ENR1 protein [Podargus strigoides]
WGSLNLYECKKRCMNPFSGVKDISRYWDNIENDREKFWKAPDGLFWICGRKAYPGLPSHWKESCTSGLIQPGFFLLPPKDGDELGVPL